MPHTIGRKKLLLLAILLAAGTAAVAGAQPMPPPPGARVPNAEELALLPGANAAQQGEIRKILLQRREAEETLHASMRTQFDALHAKERSEHERIDAQASAQLRKLLGDDGYRAYAEWTLAHRGPPPGMGAHAGPGGPDGRSEHGMGGRPDRGALALPPPPPGAPGGGHAAPGDGNDD